MTALFADWRALAACREVDGDLFFPEGDEASPATAAQIARAREVCDRCPVRPECDDYALRTGQEHGIWGGRSLEERRALRVPATRPIPVLCASGRHFSSPDGLLPDGNCRACKQGRDRAREPGRDRDQSGRKAAARERRAAA